MKASKYILLHSVVTVTLLGLLYFLLQWKLSLEQSLFTEGGMLIASLSSLAVYLLVYFGIKNDIRMFLTYVIGGLLIKMGVGLVSIFAVGILAKPHVKLFAVAFLCGYLVFTTMEVIFLMKIARAS